MFPIDFLVLAKIKYYLYSREPRSSESEGFPHHFAWLRPLLKTFF